MSDIQVHGNAITIARYDYTLTEKKIVYRIIQHLQDKMQKGVDETLFGDLILFIPMHELVSHEHYNRVRQGLVSLRRKDFEITTPDQIDPTGKGEHGFLNVGFVNWTEYNRNTGLVEFEVSRKLMPYLLELAKGFTSYSLNVALSLKSVYSQRIYECCCRFRGTGVWNISIEDFKTMLSIENDKAYIGKNANGNVKARVLEVAKKEIKSIYDKGECDLYFVYEFKKTGKIFTDIKFKIFSTKNPKHVPQMEEDRAYCINFIKGLFREERELPYVRHVSQELFNKKAYNSFALKIDSFKIKYSDTPENDRKRILRTILEQDFQIANIK